MAKDKKNNNSTKSLIMVIVTGVVLATATLCWFVTNGGSKVEEINSPILGASSTAVFYCAEDLNHDGIIDDSDIKDNSTANRIGAYEKVSENEIKLENMVPGGKYFYMVQFENCPETSKFLLSLENIEDTNNFRSYINVSACLKKVADNNAENNIEILNETRMVTKYNSSNASAELLNCDGQGAGTYRIYYDFSLDENATVSVSEYTFKVNNVNAVLVGQ